MDDTIDSNDFNNLRLRGIDRRETLGMIDRSSYLDGGDNSDGNLNSENDVEDSDESSVKSYNSS